MISVTGNVILSGSVTVTIDPVFNNIAVGDVITLMTWTGARLGQFGTIQVVGAPPNIVWTPDYSSGAFRLIATQPGPICDSIDFNADSLFPDDQDLVDYLSVLAGGPCSNDPNCNDIDFNNDGLFPSDDDLVSFLRVRAGGDC